MSSGVARLGYTGARALAARGRDPPVQVCIWTIIGTDSIIVDPESGTKQTWNRTTQYRYVYPQSYKSRTHRTQREFVSDTLKCFCTLRRISYKHSVPMLCLSIGDLLATPLLMPGSETDNSQLFEAWCNMRGWCMDDVCVLESLFNESWNCSNHALVVILICSAIEVLHCNYTNTKVCVL